MTENHAGDTETRGLMPEIQEEVDRLPEKYRSPIVLCYFEGLTHEEAAGQLQLPLGTVKVRLARARGRLRGRLIRRGLAPAALAVAESARAFGAVPSSVVDATIQAAARVAAGRAAGVSAPVAALMKGVLIAMFLTKLKTTAAVLTAGTSLILASVFLVSALPQPARSGENSGEPAPGKAVRKVVVEAATKTGLLRTTTQIGNVQAFESVDVTPRISGYLKSLAVDIGDTVKHGQVLAEIDAPELAVEHEKSMAVVNQAEARLAQARAAVAVAQASLDAEKSRAETAAAVQKRAESMLRFHEKKSARYKQLRRNNAIDEQVADEQEEHVETARAALEEAKGQAATVQAGIEQEKAKVLAARSGVGGAEADLRVAMADQRKAAIQHESLRIVAPIDGVVTKTGFHRGAFLRSAVEAGSVPLLTIMKSDKMRVVVQVADMDVPLLAKSGPATVRIYAIGDRVYEGKIARTAYAEDPSTGTLRAEIDLDNSDGRLRPGQSGTVTIILEDLGKRLSIPGSALVLIGGDAVCFRVENNRAIRTRIKVGRKDRGRIEVTEGLKEGDLVVVQPGAALADGQEVEWEPSEPLKRK